MHDVICHPGICIQQSDQDLPYHPYHAFPHTTVVGSIWRVKHPLHFMVPGHLYDCVLVNLMKTFCQFRTRPNQIRSVVTPNLLGISSKIALMNLSVSIPFSFSRRIAQMLKLREDTSIPFYLGATLPNVERAEYVHANNREWTDKWQAALGRQIGHFLHHWRSI